MSKIGKIIKLRYRTEDLVNLAESMGISLSLDQVEELAEAIAGGFGSQLDEFVTNMIREFGERIEKQEGVKTQQKEIDILAEFEELLERYDITIPSRDRQGEEGEARLYGSEYYNAEERVLTIIESDCSIEARLKDIIAELDRIIIESDQEEKGLPSTNADFMNAVRKILED